MGLVQSRPEFILPNDAYPVLENAFVWRERIKRKQGYQLLGRLRRLLQSGTVLNQTTDGTATYSNTDILADAAFNLRSTEPNAQIEPLSVTITVSGGGGVFVDTLGDGILVSANGSGTVNYSTGKVVLTFTIPPAALNTVTVKMNYFPSLPVMGLRSRELTTINNEMTVAFDQKYAYRYTNGWQEFIPGTEWSGNDSDFFWSTNYWVSAANNKLFWVTNFDGQGGEPIRYTDGMTWTDFGPTAAPTTGQTNIAGDFLNQCLCLIPFRGRLVAFNTWEGATLAGSLNYTNRIRWAQIGNPLTTDLPGAPGAWRDDVRGRGGFLDIPTTEAIVSVGFVRDNVVVYCERSTWQLRYTGRSIAPFQIERVNSELGSESTFSAIQFDTSLVGVGDKGIVECDSFKSERIDIKIPDLVFQFNNTNNGTKRVHGIRDFFQRLAFWTYPFKPINGVTGIFPNRRLVYNYENDSWAIFTDSLTCLGNYQPQSSRTWTNTKIPWNQCNFPWINRQALFPAIVGGNQQGFVEYLDQITTNDISLFIQDIQSFGGAEGDPPILVTSHNHNMQTGNVIEITGIPADDPYAFLNGAIFSIVIGDALGNNPLDQFRLYVYNSVNGQFDLPAVSASFIFRGYGNISIRDNFSVTSKKFSFLDEGQNISMGFIDILMDTTLDGAISLNVYLDYNNNSPVNIFPENSSGDRFFNSVVETSTTAGISTTKNWKRIFCPVRGAFITIEWTFSNAQMVGVEQESDVGIDAQILWIRRAGKQLPAGL